MNNFAEQLINIIKKFINRNDINTYFSHTGASSKTFISATEHLTFSAENEKLKKLVRTKLEEIFKQYKDEPAKLFDIIKDGRTEILEMKNANNMLKIIGESEGFITELKGLKALYLNLCTNKGFKFYSEPIFIMNTGIVEPVSLFHHFYKWYSYKSKLPGFDYRSQELFKKYLKYPNADTSKLSMEDVINLQEAIARDQEATDFCLYIVRETEGAKNVKQKLADGGANI